jgi:CBS domain containing-hemolysin-like protein
LGRNNFRVDAGVAISEINEDLELGLPEGDYQTVAGFMLDRLGRIPDEGDVVKYGDISLTVKTMDGVRIEEVELEQAPTSRTEVRQ